MTRQVAKVICNGEYKIMVNTDRFTDGSGKPPYYITFSEPWSRSRKQIRKCNSIHEALGVLANILIQY